MNSPHCLMNLASALETVQCAESSKRCHLGLQGPLGPLGSLGWLRLASYPVLYHDFYWYVSQSREIYWLFMLAKPRISPCPWPQNSLETSV
jgi:hypothetical protein